MAAVAGRRLFGSILRIRSQTSRMSFGSWGGGKDTDRAGAIRETGDAFAKREKAEEERYFKKLQKEQFSKLKDDVSSEIKHHEQQIKHHEEALKRHKKRLADMGKDD
uniref:ATPase inhibitor, mitochondrial n=1 Tax=Strigamia maritima TaxID=126957 RepID=T1JB47_STRMM